MIELENLLYSNYIKYDKLKDLINESFKGSNVTKIAVMIDMYSICKSIYRDGVIIGNTGSILTSSIINMIAHYRYFFRNYYQTESIFFIVNSINCGMSNIANYINYNKSFRDILEHRPDITEFIKTNIDMLDVLCQHIPDTYLINTNHETGVIMYQLITKILNNDLTNKNIITSESVIIITRDQYNYQLPAINNKVVILRPKKGINSDESYYINQNNVLEIYHLENDNKFNNTNLHPSLLSFIMALSSLKCRSIKKLFTRPKAISIIEDSIKSLYIKNNYTLSPQDALPQYIDNQTKYIISKRFQAIDIIYQSLQDYNTIITIKPYKHDPKELQHLNNVYFSSNPLDLNKL